MQRQHIRIASNDIRRARTLAGALGLVLVGAAFYANNVEAAPCGAQADFLVSADPLLAPVAPADCARVFQSVPDFTWPSTPGASSYTVSVTFPDGRTENATTATNWLAWQAPLAPGRYTWTVTAAGATPQASAARTFTVDATAAAFVATAHPAITPYPRDSHGISTLAMTASIAQPMAGETTGAAPLARAAVPMATVWTSPWGHDASDRSPLALAGDRAAVT